MLLDDPAMMADLVKAIREAETLMGAGDLDPRQVERDSEVPVRRSIAAARDLQAGEAVGPEDIMWIRPGEQFAPGREAEVLGRKLAKPVGAGELFRKDDFSA